MLLIAIGAIGLSYGGNTVTKHEGLVDVGPLHMEAMTEGTNPLPAVLGGVALLSGVLLVRASRKE